MLSRLYDERVFTSSDDVVFSASSSQALLRNGGNSSRVAAPRRDRLAHRTRHGLMGEDLHEEEDEESKSEDDGMSSGSDEEEEAPADDELEEEDEDEAGRAKGLRFPLQSPRHIAASQSYLHRQRRHLQLKGDDGEATSPAAAQQRRHAKKLLDEDANARQSRTAKSTRERGADGGSESGGLMMARDFARRKIGVQYHDRPMELVYLPTGEIRPRDECPPSLRLPPATGDVRRLLAAEPTEETRKRVNAKLDESVASSTVHITRQEAARPSAIQTNGKKTAKRTTRRELSESEKSDPSGEHDDGRGGRSGGQADRNETYGNLRSREAPTLSKKVPGTVSRTRRGAPDFPDRAQRCRDEQEKPVRGVHRRYAESSDDEATTGGPGRRNCGDQRDDGPARRYQSENTGLEAELQKEKKRVLEKMTQLLEEQGKTQALQLKLQTMQEKMASMEKELENYAQREASNAAKDESLLTERNDRIRVLSDELRTKDENIRGLQSRLEQATRSKHDRESGASKDDDRVLRLRKRESALAKQLEELMNRVTDFHSSVESWKVNSREALNGCGKRADVLELMDQLWMDFPPFISAGDALNRNTSNEGESSTIAFLTKKLRQKEEELRLTHVKYVELKELCARQCIREADLQNFINEHRLRGNLVIRKTDNQDVSHRQMLSRGQENSHLRANGQSNAKDNVAYQAPELHSDDEGESEADDDFVVHKPRVFIDIKRSNQQSGTQQEPSPIEHVRLAPSPALAQRYRQQQQQHHLPSRQMNGIPSATHTTRGATVASASRALATSRQALTTTSRTTTAQKRYGVGAQNRTGTTARSTSVSSKNASARASMASRRPSQAPLTSRPWV